VAIGTSHGKTHIFETRVRKVKTGEGKWKAIKNKNEGKWSEVKWSEVKWSEVKWIVDTNS
jgi:hypothetical protein